MMRTVSHGIAPWLTGTAMLALIAGGTAVRAQSFLANSSVAAGNAVVTTGANTTTIDVRSSTAIVDWTPTDTATGGGAIAFQQAGTTATYLTTAGLATYTVLNRITPTDATRGIRFDGNVLSTVAGGARGGNVWFYSPGGIIVGATARFDIGSLILTTDAIDTGNGVPDAATGIRFAGPRASRYGVTIEAPSAGDRGIFASMPGSYVALVAPRIAQGGTVSVNGSVGYLAASAADVTINAGLFAISNAVGSVVNAGGETTLVHTGTTTGAAATNAADPHVIYMVNVAQNDAVTMLVSGNVGYAAATTAGVENGEVVLGAGATVSGDPAQFSDTSVYPLLGSNAGASMTLTNATFTSAANLVSAGDIALTTNGGDLAFTDMLGEANGNISLTATANRSITAAGLLDLESEPNGARATATVSVASGATLAVGDLLQIFTDAGRLTFDAAGTVQAGAINLSASGLRTPGVGSSALTVTGSVTVASQLRIAARSFGGTAGNASLAVNGGTVDTADLVVQADTQGAATSPNVRGGAAAILVDGGRLTATGTMTVSGAATGAGQRTTGGAATLQAIDGGTITANAVTLLAGASGGVATGGTADIRTTDATITIGGALAVDASADGTTASTGGTANLVSLGTIGLTAPTAVHTIDVSARGGSARGGGISAYAGTGGTVTIAGGLTARATGANGDGATVRSTGGTIELAALGGATSVGGATSLDASGTAGGVNTAGAAAGYDAKGGSVTVLANGAALTLGDLRIDDSAIAVQNAAIATGSATGGTGLITATGGTATIAGSLLIDSSANGNSLGSGAITSSGGSASLVGSGGTIALTSLTAPLEIAADAQGGVATGGITQITVDGGGAITVATALSAHAQGFGGYSTAASDAYTGTGGTVRLIAADGTITTAGLDLRASGGGGLGDATHEGGAGIGGSASIATTGTGAITASGYVSVFAEGNAGTGGTGAATGTGGRTLLQADGGTIALTGITGPVDLLMFAGGAGSAAQTSGGAPAGRATGGTTAVLASGGGTIAMAGNAVLNAGGTGGAAAGSGTGGTGTGGIVRVETGTLPGGGIGTITAGTLQLDAYGIGGDGGTGTGGAATGGRAQLIADSGTISGGTLDLSSRANGGAGTVGGAASDGTARVAIDGGTVDFGTASVQSILTGGAGGGIVTGGAASLTLTAGRLAGGNWSVAALDTAGDGSPGHVGGGATGGSARIAIDGGVAQVTGLAARGVATGGSGGPGASVATGNGTNGSAGGDATSGAASITITGGSADGGAIGLASTAYGGGGGTGGLTSDPAGVAGSRGAGGNATTGNVALRASGGTLTGGTTRIGTLGLAGAGNSGGDATSGGVTIATSGLGTIALGATSLTTDGNAGVANVAGPITLSVADAGGATPLTLASLDVVQIGDRSGAAQPIVIAAAAPIAVTGDASFSGDGPVRIAAQGIGQLRVGGALSIAASEVIATQAGAPAGLFAIDAGSAAINAEAGGVRLTNIITRTGDLSVNATDTTRIGTAVSAGDLTIAGRDVQADTLTADAGSIGIDAFGDIAIGAVAAADEVTLYATGAERFDTVSAGGSIGLFAGTTLTLGTARAGGDIALLARTGALRSGALIAGTNGSVALLGGDLIAVDAITAPRLLYVGGPAALAGLPALFTTTDVIAAVGASGPVASGGAVRIGAIDTGTTLIAAGTTLTLSAPLVARQGAAMLLAGAGIATGDVTATGTVAARSATGTIVLGDVAAGTPGVGGAIMLLADAGAVRTGTLNAAAGIAVASTGGSVRLGNAVSSGGVFRASATGDLALGTVSAAGSIYLNGGGTITAGDLTAGTGPMLASAPSFAAIVAGGTAAPAGIAPGFDQASLVRCDDCSTTSVALPFTVNYFGRTYGDTYVSSNGYLTFGQGQSTYTPEGLGTGYSGLPIVAAFFADVDTTSAPGAQVTYGTGTFAGHTAFAANWNGVGYYDNKYDKLNRFQIVLTDRSDTGSGNFDIYYNYGSITWETGDVDGGVAGLGGSSASVGYNAGTGNQAGRYYSQPGSLVAGSFLDNGTMPLVTTTNDGNPGQLMFSVRNGQVIGGSGASPATISVSNVGTGNTGAIRLGNLSAETVEVHGAGDVRVGNVATGDRGSGASTGAGGQPFATVLDATGGLVTGDIAGGGLIALGARDRDVSTGALTTPGSVVVLAGGGVALGAVTTGSADTLFVSAPGGAPAGFDFATLLSGTGFAPATLASATPTRIGGTLTLRDAIATGNLRAAASGPIRVGAVSATDTILLDTAGALAVRGTIDANDITLSSRDIAINPGVAVGSARTTMLTFANTGTGVTYLGDVSGAAAGDYLLSGAELRAAHAQAIGVSAPGDAVIGNVALTGSGAGDAANLVGSQGSFAVTAANGIRLIGAMDITRLAAGSSVSLDAGTAITGVLPDARIVLTGDGDALAGTLALDAPTIAFATQAALTGLATATLDDAEAALATPAAGTSRSGYLRADSVRFTVDNALYTQNSGASTAQEARAGVRAGAGGITVTGDSEGGAIRMILNARFDLPGETLTGANVTSRVLSLIGTTRFADGSRINGCLISGGDCARTLGNTQATRDTATQGFPPIQDIVNQIRLPTGLGTSAAYSFATPALISLVDLSPLLVAPLIDEPVTGAGNDDLWVGIGLGADRDVAPLGGAMPGATPSK